MKFLVDAQLPSSLCDLMQRGGHDAIHTLQLPGKNRTSDAGLNEVSLREERVLVSKDTDFYYSHLLYRRPYKLLPVRTGNLRMAQLLALFERNLPAVVEALEHSSLVELGLEHVERVC